MSSDGPLGPCESTNWDQTPDQNLVWSQYCINLFCFLFQGQYDWNMLLQLFSQKPHTPTVAQLCQIGPYALVEAVWQQFCNSWRVRLLGERLYSRFSKTPRCNCCTAVTNRPLRPRGGRLATVLQELEYEILGEWLHTTQCSSPRRTTSAASSFPATLRYL